MSQKELLNENSSVPGKIEVFDLYMKLILLFPVFTVFKGGSVLNKILFATVFALQLLMMFKRPIKRRSFLQIIIMGIDYVHALFLTTFPMGNSNLLFYYPFNVLFILFIIDEQDKFIDWLENRERYVRFIIKLWTLIVGISIFIPSCYYVKEGGAFYFGSFIGTIFRLGPAALYIQALALVSMAVYKRRKDIIFMIIPLYCYFMGSSRTYLIIGLCLFVVAWYWYVVSKKIFFATIVPLIAVSIFIISYSSIGDKITYTLDDGHYGDFWFRITSSRSLLWSMLLEAWNNFSIFNKVLGGGLNMTFQTTGLWAHNDFIELLCSTGIVGIVIYISLIIQLLRSAIAGRGVPISISICVFLTWFFNAFFNMHYVYFCATLCYPFVLYAVRQYYAYEIDDSDSDNIVISKEI